MLISDAANGINTTPSPRLSRRFCQEKTQRLNVENVLEIRGRALRIQRAVGAASAATSNRGRSHKNAICRYKLSDVCCQCVVMHIMMRAAESTVGVAFNFFLFFEN